jgi:hypothetical protein
VIRKHEVNSRWWGAPVGIVDDAAFFALPGAEQAELLAPFAWAEFRARLEAAPDPWALARAGFASCDVQVGFRIALGRIPQTPSAGTLDVVAADEQPFDPGGHAVRPFQHERFALLHGAGEHDLGARYLSWARNLVAEHPAWCFEILSEDGTPQGWYCSRPEGRSGVELTLAALYEQATISGLTLYEAAIRAYAARGARTGVASFSVRNHAAHGIYAALGARFVAATGFWLWQQEKSA